MQITLLRHGKVNYPPIANLSASLFSEWVVRYNTNALDSSSKPMEDALSIASQSNAVVCSALPRSIESAKTLGVEKVTYSHSMFNEADLPIANWSFPRLSVRIWVLIFRLAWLFGYSRNSESLAEAKARAALAALKLIELAETYETVLFIGHGLINRFIAKELRKKNWNGPKIPGKKYWEFGVFSQHCKQAN